MQSLYLSLLSHRLHKVIVEPCPMPSITLDQIPTLTQFYRDSILRATASIKYKYNLSLLDKISLFQGDITTLNIDAIVNAANKSLLGGGGVDGAIHRAAGPGLLSECRRLNGCATGQAKITRGYDLPARHVIHAVGPLHNTSAKDECAELLASCYTSSLQLATEHNLRHIAFPAISTGVYGYPIEEATGIALKEVRQFCESEVGAKLDRIILVVFSEDDAKVYRRVMKHLRHINNSLILIQILNSRIFPASIDSVGACFNHSDCKNYSCVEIFVSPVKTLRYPLCNKDVLGIVYRRLSLGNANQVVSCELPKRLFRNLNPKPGNQLWKDNDGPLPFLHYLYNVPGLRPEPNSYEGYALTRAVYARHEPLIRFLLEHGALPSCKEGLCVMVAIRQKNLALVKLLMEREDKSSINGGRKNKKRKLEDRIVAGKEMLRLAVKCNARDIVEYLTQEKGVIPDMQTLLGI
ncbi:hypothetical protein AX15_001962 [Amanita polypyramis BW_CC]|nr:hypothetical protein AX15_001962 [Amanita polypyramis BW_CC]